MASMAPPRANGSSYDVFLSFRGEDTRHSFTDHLYAALTQAGIYTFRDSDDAGRGKELKQEIERAIKASDASIIVLSENFATSTWCLDELTLILDQRRDCNHFVLPLFYHVDPSDVGNHRGTFMIAANPSRRWTDENVNRWKAALTEVVSVTGISLVGSETIFIKEVVDTIHKRLDCKQIYITPYVTGIDTQYKKIFNLWLKQPNVDFLVINGMPGSGKSTLAQYIVYLHGQHYESNSIVDKIGTRCKNTYEMVTLQQQLCSDISKRKDISIHSICQGTAQIEMLLEKIQALIVLDEIVQECQLDDLLGSGYVNNKSKIIITTDADISNWFIAKSKRYHEHKMKLLDNDEALELLSLHAFRSKIPKDGYNELAQQAVRYCDGNPLALAVLGSSLSQKNTITSWESELSSFERSIHDKIYAVLRKSYDWLPDFEKELFLHIACFFVAKDMDYVVKILEPDCAAESKIKNLINRHFLYVTKEKKLMMHRLLQGMGRSLVDRESRIPAKRTRVWRNEESYDMLKSKKSSMKIEGLALDIQMLMKENAFKSRQIKELSTDSLQQMDRLKLLKLNFVKLNGPYNDLSADLRWLCWVGFSESTIQTDLFMGNMVALDMSYSCLKEFKPPTVLRSLKILNLKDSYSLLEICNIDHIPNLETLVIWNCHRLFHVCRNIGNLERLILLNMTGCKNLCKREHVYTSVELYASISGGGSTQELAFPLPCLLQRLFLDDCNLECTESFPLSFNDQKSLQYLNLGNGLFEILPSYNCLKNLRVLDLRNCSRLKRLLCLPTTLAELYINDCWSIEKITFESGRFKLQEFGYEGCFNLCEIEGLVKLMLVAKLDETDLGHMIWVKEYQDREVCLVGNYELTTGRSCYLQMLYEFNIMSTSLPDIKHPNLVPEYTSQSTSVSFDVPCCPISSSLRGLNVILRYKIPGDDWAWFAKVSMTDRDDLTYSPNIFGRPASGEVCIWLSYWPIGNLLNVGDEVTVSIVVMSGLEVLECGASLVYTDDDVAHEIFENKLGWVEGIGRDLSGFRLSNGSYYLCRSDFYKLMELGRLTRGWLHSLVGDTLDDTGMNLFPNSNFWALEIKSKLPKTERFLISPSVTEVRGWRMAGRPQQSYQSFTELKTVRCIIHCPETVGPLLSDAITKLVKIVIYVAKTTANFKPELGQLQNTLERITPIIQDIVNLNRKLDRTEVESQMFIEEIQKAEKLVRKCLEIKRNFIKKFTYSLKLKDVNNKVLQFFKLEVQAVQARDTKQKLVEVNDVVQKLDSLSMSISYGREQEGQYELDRGKFGWRVPILPRGIVAFDEPLKKLKDKILADDDEDDGGCSKDTDDGIDYDSVIVVVAVGGCGKTTLVTKLCYDSEIKGKFGEKVFFVTVSETPNFMVIVNDLFNPGSSDQPIPFQSDEDAKLKLRNFLRDKISSPMLLVLDDVWSDSFIDNFPSKIKGCKIVVTSRTTFHRYNVFNFDPLSDEDATTLFQLSAFTESKERPRAAIDGGLVNQIVKHCKKHPLTLSVVGSSLNGRDESAWKSMLKSLNQGISVLDMCEQVRICLERSFKILDEEFKECFMDFGLFPEDQRIPASALLDMWVHLYNHDDEGIDTFDKIVGLSYRHLVNLVTTGLRKDTCATLNYCDHQFVKQHDLLRELAIHLSSKAEVPIAQRKRLIVNARGEDLPSSIVQVQEPMQARILSISTGESFSSRWCNMKVPNVEVMVLNLMSKTYTLPHFLTDMQKMKVLNVTNYGLYPIHIEDFRLIGCLSNLLRIRLEHLSISSLSTSILALVNLQKVSFIMCKIGNAFENLNNNFEVWPRLVEIEMDYCQDLVEFPAILCSSVHLKTLRITNCNEMCVLPNEIGNLTSLETLSLRSCMKLEKLPESITRLEKLNIMDISDCLNLEALPEEMGNLSGLRTINMKGCTGIHELPSSVEKLYCLNVVCNEEIAYKWSEYPNVEIDLVEENRLETLMIIEGGHT